MDIASAMDLQAPIPTVDTSVSMRDISKYKQLREKAAALYAKDPIVLRGDKAE
jgi:6-phosphogluconate dehydrogenase